jgi:hypothetical protein
MSFTFLGILPPLLCQGRLRCRSVTLHNPNTVLEVVQKHILLVATVSLLSQSIATRALGDLRVPQ